MYQVGALKAFLDEAQVPLNHIKPHGMWVSIMVVIILALLTAQYISMQSDEMINDAAMRAIKVFNVPVYGLPGTLHESGAKKYNIPFIPEAFVDVNYNNKGALMGVPGSRKMESSEIYDITKKLGTEGQLPSVDYTMLDVGVSGKPFTLCLHSDFANCRENVAAARRAVDEVNAELYA